MSLAKHFDEEKFIKTWRASKEGLVKSEARLNDMVDKATAKEKNDIEAAIDRFNKKVGEVTKSKEYKEVESEVQTYKKQVGSHLSRAIGVFEEKRKEIMSHPQKGGAEKKKEVAKVYEYILSKLYTPDEIKAFQRHVVIVTSPNHFLE